MMHPEWFAAIVPICGGGMNWNAQKLKNTPIWAFHGALDTVVPVYESRYAVEAVNKIGGNARLTVYDDVLHDSWTYAFSEDSLYEWLSKLAIIKKEDLA